MTILPETKSPTRRAGEFVGAMVGLVARGFLFGTGLLLALVVFGVLP